MESKNLDIYGAEAIPWDRVLRQLEAGDSKGSYFLATTRPDGRPHVAGIGAIWVDGKFYFVSGASTRKSQNLAKNPNCALGGSLRDIDVTVEGTAAIVRDRARLKHVAERYVAIGWPAEVSGAAFTAPYSAPSAGPAPWDLYELTAASAIGVAGAEPFGATRWKF
ncbi:MAG TPA: pyridoxamine 5'-phosphate oxidase family protein [Candidatus Dormibacteraeota bacterium]|nr:pyridoxamine 5'-phosphate oxidase family protein [Candidatus Dormibacteraeota bacterium]